jgi:hypothetical protein
MFRLTVTEVETLRKGELETMVQSAFVLGLFTLFLLLVAIIGSLMFAPAWLNMVALGALFLGGMAIGLVIWTGIRKARGHPKAFMDWWTEWVAGEIKAKQPTPPLPPALPATLPQENRMIQVTAGDRVVDVSLTPPVHGFEERDLIYLCELIAGGYKFTEEYMERLKLPVSREVMGKAQDGTPYSRFMDLCVAAGIIEGRKPKYSGKLVVTDAAEMMERLKKLEKEDITP